MHYVYHLIDPRTGVVRYVGKAASPKSRLKGHIAEAQKRQVTEKQKWIAELLALGREPLLVIAASAPDDVQARVLESRHCHMHRDTIFNIHDPAKGAKDL